MVNRMGKPETARTGQYIQNLSFDEEFGIATVALVEFDGNNLVRKLSSTMQTKIVSDSGYTYICKAPVGTALSDAKWQVSRIDSTGSKMFADADSEFDNIATDPTTLSFSYS